MPTVPSVPDDWEAKEMAQAPYVLGIIDGAQAWRSVVVGQIVSALSTATVTDSDGHAVYVFPH